MAGVLILGGRSDIGGEIAQRVARGNDIVLAARGTHGLEEITSQLEAAGARSVHQLSFDAEDFSQHRQIFAEAKERVGAIELTVVAFGILGGSR